MVSLELHTRLSFKQFFFFRSQVEDCLKCFNKMYIPHLSSQEKEKPTHKKCRQSVLKLEDFRAVPDDDKNEPRSFASEP